MRIDTLPAKLYEARRLIAVNGWRPYLHEGVTNTYDMLRALVEAKIIGHDLLHVRQVIADVVLEHFGHDVRSLAAIWSWEHLPDTTQQRVIDVLEHAAERIANKEIGR